MEKLLSVTECAELTATTPAFWRKLLYHRAIPFVKVGRCVRIRESDLEAWLRAGAQTVEKRGALSMGKWALLDFIATLVRLLECLLNAYWRI